ncbi:MAG: Flp pilus assembly protein CpaB [Candidatus Dormibacteria bacterium]
MAQASGRSNRTMLIAGVVLAVLGFGLTLFIARGTGGGGTAALVPLVVAAHDLQAGLTLSAKDVEVIQVSQAAIPPSSFTKVDQPAGKVVALEIKMGQPVLDNFLVASSSEVPTIASPALHIPAGYVAVSIPDSEMEGVSFFIQPGDRIDIIGSPLSDLTHEARYTFRDLEVIKVGTNSAVQANAAGATSIVVLVKADEAEFMKYLVDNYNLRYVLRSLKDYDQPGLSAPGVGIGEFRAKFGFR